MDNQKIIQEFIDETTIWIKSMSKMNAENQCPMCGLVPENMSKLAEAVKELREKAWKYDELCK